MGTLPHGPPHPSPKLVTKSGRCCYWAQRSCPPTTKTTKTKTTTTTTTRTTATVLLSDDWVPPSIASSTLKSTLGGGSERRPTCGPTPQPSRQQSPFRAAFLRLHKSKPLNLSMIRIPRRFGVAATTATTAAAALSSAKASEVAGRCCLFLFSVRRGAARLYTSQPFKERAARFPPGIEILIDPSNKSRSNGRQSADVAGRHNNRTSARRGISRPFVDRVRLRAEGGRGGLGSLSSQPLARKRRLKPDGGNGGDGGSVVIVAVEASHSNSTRTTNLSSASASSLEGIPRHVSAPRGGNGTSQNRHGGRGRNALVSVPCGTIVKSVQWVEDDFGGSFKGSVRVDNGQDSRLAPSSMANEVFVLDSEADLDELEQHQHQKQIERRPSLSFHILADLDRPGSSCVVARGGRGGLGTAAGLAMSRRRRRHHGPVFAPDAHRLVQCAQGEPGEVAFLELELKLVGDVGLVGLPNAGKSSILAAISRAQPKVAPYPFTTLHPVVGVVEYRDGFRMRVADIPGLIEGASIGRGMGLDFLRHVERTRALLYVLDVSSYLNYSSSHEMTVPDPVRDLRTLVEEIEQYDESLLSRPCIVAANKVDLLQPQPGNDVVCRGESYDRLGYDSRSSDETNQNEIQRIQELLRRLEDESQTLGIRCESRVVGTSGVTGQGLAELASMIRTVVEPPRDDADDNDGERLGG